MLDLSRMFGGQFASYQPQMQYQTQHPDYAQPDPINGRDRRLQRRQARLGDRTKNLPYDNGQNTVTQDLPPQQDPMNMMDAPFVSEGWEGYRNSPYGQTNLGMMLGRSNFF